MCTPQSWSADVPNASGRGESVRRVLQCGGAVRPDVCQAAEPAASCGCPGPCECVLHMHTATCGPWVQWYASVNVQKEGRVCSLCTSPHADTARCCIHSGACTCPRCPNDIFSLCLVLSGTGQFFRLKSITKCTVNELHGAHAGCVCCRCTHTHTLTSGVTPPSSHLSHVRGRSLRQICKPLPENLEFPHWANREVAAVCDLPVELEALDCKCSQPPDEELGHGPRVTADQPRCLHCNFVTLPCDVQ